MDHEVALPLRALRRGGGMDVFVTYCDYWELWDTRIVHYCDY